MIERLRGAHEAEPGRMVEAGDGGRQHPPVGRDDEDRLGFEQQVTYRQDMAGVIDQYAGAFARGAQRVGGARGRRHADAEFHDGAGEIVRGKFAASRQVRGTPRGPRGGDE